MHGVNAPKPLAGRKLALGGPATGAPGARGDGAQRRPGGQPGKVNVAPQRGGPVASIARQAHGPSLRDTKGDRVAGRGSGDPERHAQMVLGRMTTSPAGL
jgi:hypothetical protein